MTRYIGIDLHQVRFTACFRDEGGGERLATFRLDRMADFLKQLHAEDEVAVEATSNSPHFYRQVAPHVRRVHLVNPSQFRVVAASAKKTDRHDARQLAFFLSTGMLPEVRPSEPPREQLKSLLATREQLVKARTARKNKVHAVLVAQGLKRSLNLDSPTGLARTRELAQNDAMRFELEILCEQIQHLAEAVAKIDRQLQDPRHQLPGQDQITSIPGIGTVGGSVLLCAIGSIADFEDADHLASYFGIVPSVRQSDQRCRSGSITKRGNRHARRVLVQCAWVAIRFHPGLRAFYERIQARRGKSKAIVATARKLVHLVHYTLKHQIVWEDCAAGVIAA